MTIQEAEAVCLEFYPGAHFMPNFKIGHIDHQRQNFHLKLGDNWIAVEMYPGRRREFEVSGTIFATTFIAESLAHLREYLSPRSSAA